jgi:anti-sigma regulatory factor (Ser/Thr protein kinase)
MFFREQLPKEGASAWQARRALDRLKGQVGETTLENARLLVSELVANAVEQAPGDGEIALEVTLAVGVLRVEVHDEGGGILRDGAGWGLFFVEQLAERWGTEDTGGHSVWFEISA